MTTAEFYNRLLRPLKVNSLESMSMNDGLELVDALNAALQWFYAAAPDVYRRKEQSHYLPPSRTVTVTMTKGSKTISAGLHDEDGFAILTEEEQLLTQDGVIVVEGDHYGATIKIVGDDNWNRVAGENLLRDPYLGESGTYEATIYSDAIVLSGSSIERMANDPRLDTGRVLHHEDLSRQHNYGYDIDRRELSFFLRSNQRTVAEPRRFFLGHPGDDVPGKINDQGYILVDPIPDKAYTVTFDAFHKPQRFGINSLLVAPEVLPLADDMIETILLPVAIEQLTDSPMWRGDERSISRAERRAGEARGLAQNLSPFIAVPDNKVGTPRGY